MILAVALAWAGDCAVPADLPALEARLGEAEAAFAALDVESFGRSMDDAAFLVPCLADPLSPRDAARYHRLQGLRQYVTRSDERAGLSFAAARAADPGYALPDTLVPPGHALRSLYTAVPLESGTFETVASPRAGELHFDGTAGTSRPRSWPTVVQVLDGAGKVDATAYLLPTDPLPPYDAKPLPKARAARPGLVPLVVGASGSAVASAVLYGLAVQSKADLVASDPGWDRDEQDARATRTNALVVGSGAVGVVAVGVGVLAVAVAW